MVGYVTKELKLYKGDIQKKEEVCREKIVIVK